jgi:uroporphyrinogen decarboxylase
VPIAFGGPECSIHRAAHRALLEHLGLEITGPARVIDTILQIVEPDTRLIERFGIDALWLVPNEGPVKWGDGRRSYVDEFDRKFETGGGFFNQVGYPLEAAEPGELAAFPFPAMDGPGRVAGLRERAQQLCDRGYGLVADGPWGIYEVSCSLRGTENLLVDMVLQPTVVEALAERVLEEYLIPLYTNLLASVGEFAQMVVVSDDYGSQQGLLFSPKHFRRFYKPRLERLVSHIRTITDAKIYIHSDGAISSIIPDFIDAGLDGLNPVQYTASGMEPAALKREFGADLGFFGGGVDNEVLSAGTPSDVRCEAQRQIRALAPGGGYTLATIHNIPPEAPPHNVAAFFDAGRELGRYPNPAPGHAAGRG